MRTTNRTIGYLALLGAAVLAAGCDTSEAKPSAGVAAVESAQVHVAQATEQANAARAALVKEMKSELAKINEVLQQFSAKVERSDHAAKSDAKAKLEALREKVAQMNAEIEKAKNAPEAAWEQVKASFKKSDEDLKEAVAQTRTWLAEKIAP